MHYIFHSEFRIIFHPTIIHSLFTLGHPNLRLFISHGGLLGTQEAIYHSVPMLGLPVVNDQLRNMVKLVKEGVAFSLLWEEINTDNLNAALNSLLKDSR